MRNTFSCITEIFITLSINMNNDNSNYNVTLKMSLYPEFVKHTILKQHIDNNHLLQDLIDLVNRKITIMSLSFTDSDDVLLNVLVKPAIEVLDGYYSNKLNNMTLKRYLVGSSSSIQSPSNLEQTLERFYIISLVSEFLEFDKNILMLEEDWMYYATELFTLLPRVRCDYKKKHSYFLVELTRHLKMYLLPSMKSLGNILLHEITNCKPRITTCPNNTHKDNFHNIFFSLRKEGYV